MKKFVMTSKSLEHHKSSAAFLALQSAATSLKRSFSTWLEELFKGDRDSQILGMASIAFIKMSIDVKERQAREKTLHPKTKEEVRESVDGSDEG